MNFHWDNHICKAEGELRDLHSDTVVILSIIDEFLAHHPRGDQLWNLLTALRGPDDGPDDEGYDHRKMDRTAPLRGLLFPKTHRAGTLCSYNRFGALSRLP